MTPRERDDALLAHVQNLRADISDVREGVTDIRAHVTDLLQRTARMEERQQAAKDAPARWASGVAVLGVIWSLLREGLK